MPAASNPRFFRRCSIWCPTLAGWLCILAALGGPLLLWWFQAEAFLSVTDRRSAEVLILEAWTESDGAHAAALEFKSPGASYRHLLAVGGLNGEPWRSRRWSTTAIAQNEFSRAGIAADQVILASMADIEDHRTFQTALTAREALTAHGLRPQAVNVFTRAAHARRSRLIFSKVFGPDTQVGVIGWVPHGYATGPWWRSRERTSELFKESFGYAFELLLNSGRRSNAPR